MSIDAWAPESKLPAPEAMVRSMARIDELEAELRSNPRRWIVTGAAGFVGSHICEQLVRLGQNVVAYDNLSTGFKANLEAADVGPGTLKFVEADIRDAAALAKASEGADHFVHQAAMASVPASMADPIGAHEINVSGFVNALEAARAAKCKSFVYASSSAVYGDDARQPKREPETGEALSPYAVTKSCNEVYAIGWTQSYGMPALGLRYFNVVGTRQDPKGAYAAVIPRWLSEFTEGTQPKIFGDGETTRDFCPVRDVVQANLLAALAPAKTPSRVFNVGLGRRTSLNELFTMLRDSMAQLGADCATQSPQYDDFRAGDIRHSHADTTRAVEELGFAPRIDLGDCLAETAAYFYARREK